MPKRFSDINFSVPSADVYEKFEGAPNFGDEVKNSVLFIDFTQPRILQMEKNMRNHIPTTPGYINLKFGGSVFVCCGKFS